MESAVPVAEVVARVNDLLEARDDKRLLRLQLAKQDLLIVDELGYVVVGGATSKRQALEADLTGACGPSRIEHSKKTRQHDPYRGAPYHVSRCHGYVTILREIRASRM